MQLPAQLVGGTLHQAVGPAYSRIQRDRERLERAVLRTKRLSVALVAPALVGVIVVAQDAIDVVFGDKWDDAVLPLQLLCVGGLAASLSAMNWSLLQAVGQAGVLLRITILTALVTWSAVALGLTWGIVGVAALYAVARWLLVLPTTLMTARGASFSSVPLLRAGADVLPLAVSAGAAAFAVREVLLTAGAGPVVRLVLVAGALALAYGSMLALVVPSLLAEVREVVLRRTVTVRA
jgi:PST family polysaccharide transporter